MLLAGGVWQGSGCPHNATSLLRASDSPSCVVTRVHDASLPNTHADTKAVSTSGAVLLGVENRINAGTEPDVDVQLVPGRFSRCIVRAGHAGAVSVC